MLPHKYVRLSIAVVGVFAFGVSEGACQTTSEEAAMESKMPTPQKEHQWLERFAGEWTSEAECKMPGGESFQCSGTQTARLLGGFWMIAEGSADMMGTPVRSVLTIGYDPAKQHYVGTWIDSCNNHMWEYKGTLDESGDVLTLETEGPNMMGDGGVAKFREVVEFKGDDHYTFTSSMQGEDGQWQAFMNASFRRTK